MQIKFSINKAVPLIFVVLVLCFGHVFASTLEAANESELKVEDKVYSDPLKQTEDQIWQSIEKRREEVAALSRQLEKERGDGRESLFIRLNQRQREMLKDYDKLTDNLLQQRDKGLDIGQSLERLKPLMLPIGPNIRRWIQQRERESEVAEKGVEPLSDKDLQLQRQANYYTDMAYSELSRHSNNLALLGFDNKQSSTYLREALAYRAEQLAGQIQIAKGQIDAAIADLADDSSSSELKARVRAAKKRMNILTDSLYHTIELMDKNSIDSTEYRQLLIRITGELTLDILKPEILSGLVGNWLDRAGQLFSQYGSAFLFKGVMLSSILLIFYYLGRTVSKFVQKGLRKSRLNTSILMEKMLAGLAAKLIFAIGFLIALGQMGVSLAPVLAGLGMAGFIIGFALQDTLSNFASGIMILIYKPYDVGDMIEAGGVKGYVESMNLVSTTILTIDHQTLIVPNNKIWGDVINNLTARKLRRVDMTFGVGYSEDAARVEAILKDIVESHPKTLAEPECTIKLHALSDSSVDFIVRPWVKTEDYWDVYWDITRTVKDRFDAEGISIPFPQRDVHLYQHTLPENVGAES